MSTAEDLELALRANSDQAIEEVLEECERRRSVLGEWVGYSLALVQALACAGVSEDFVLAVLRHVGPLRGYEEEWRQARVDTLNELAIQRGTEPGENNISAEFEVAHKLMSVGVERRAAMRQARAQLHAGLILRGPRLQLSETAQTRLQEIRLPDGASKREL